MSKKIGTYNLIFGSRADSTYDVSFSTKGDYLPPSSGDIITLKKDGYTFTGQAVNKIYTYQDDGVIISIFVDQISPDLSVNAAIIDNAAKETV